MDLSQVDMTRRHFGKALAFGAAAAVATPLLAACGTSATSGGSARTTLRVGATGGGTSETLNPNAALSETDVARTAQIFEGLTTFDPTGKVVNRLAESVEPNAAGTVWTVRLKEATFHDGSTVSADDVIYSLTYMLDPASKADGAGPLADVDLASTAKVDDKTVAIALTKPNFLFPTLLGERSVVILKSGTTTFDAPIGTGPFKLVSFKAGDRAKFVRYDGYYGGAPAIEELEIVSIDDPQARVNALSSGVVDAIAEVAPQLIASTGSLGLQLLQATSGSFSTQYMDITQGPFKDKRVRQAMRLLADRDQMISNALSGAGGLGNDLSSPFDSDYASDLPQRGYDPDQAKSLLKAAGAEGLKVTLHTSDAGLAMLESSTLYASQAKAAGVTVGLRKWSTSDYWSRAWMQQPFACSHWGGRPLISHLQLSVLPGASYNETQWNDPAFNALVADAMGSADESARHDKLVAAQKMLYDDGGYIVWGFAKNVDATVKGLSGITPSAIRSLGNYDFREATFA
ncbi:MAG: ABC transporter substrate-binding protein [Nocardioides sp.]|uniref:ABC transporter substrate-binding protein n=1 Tax=Nocardioides sp. TaxID=35761 RepID=UPI0039E6D986